MLDSLSVESTKWIASLPVEVDYTLSSYRTMMEGIGGHGSGSAENLVAAQALKDAIMAHFISLHQKKGNLFYHVNGAFHTYVYRENLCCPVLV